MLTKKDLEKIRTIVQEELKACFGRTVLMQKGPRKQGDPEKRTEQKEMDIVTALMIYLPRIEAALRGMQEDVDHAKNGVALQIQKLDSVGQALLGMQDAALTLAKATDKAMELGFVSKNPDQRLIEG